MLRFVFPLLATFIILMPQPVVAQDPPEKSESNDAKAAATTPDTVKVDTFAEDSEIETRLTNILEASGWFTEIEIKSVDGFVTIGGNTDDDANKAWAQDIAERTQSVVGVRNDLVVDSNLDLQGSFTVVFRSLNELYRGFLSRLPFLIAGMLIVAATWFVSKITDSLLVNFLKEKKRIRRSLKDLFRQFLTISVWVAGLMLATVVIFPGMTPAKALAVLGLGSVAIGFAFKDIFENFFAGVLILWKYPFDKGDYIRLEDIVGQVEDISIRNTMVKRMDGELVVIPNAQIFKSNVEVLTHESLRRIRIICGVAYKEDVATARDIIKKAASDCEKVNPSRPVEVFAKEFADSSVNFEVAWWTEPTPLAIRQSRDEVVTAIKKSLDAEGIEIPFPYRTITYAE